MSDWERDDYDEGEDEFAGASCYPPGGGNPRLLAKQCSTCIYRPGNLMRLNPGRLHQTLPGCVPESYGGGALCRGFYDKFGPKSNFIRVIERIGGFTEVPPPEGDH